MHPVHKPAAKGIFNHCFGTKEAQNNSTISLLSENGVRLGGEVCTHIHIFTSFCHLDTNHNGFRVAKLE